MHARMHVCMSDSPFLTFKGGAACQHQRLLAERDLIPSGGGGGGSVPMVAGGGGGVEAGGGGGGGGKGRRRDNCREL